MIKEHSYCKPPDNPNIMIWKYLDFTKFIDLLTSKKLYFSRFDKFDDIFEGSLPRKSVLARTDQLKYFGVEDNTELLSDEFWDKIGLDLKQKFAASCWHMNNHESTAMWKVYLKTNEGVAIQSTYNRLYNCLNETKDPIYLSVVHYKDFETETIHWGNRMVPFVHKRISYGFEQELRAIIKSDDGYDLDKGGYKVGININKLIENIFIAPAAPIWFTELVKTLVADLKINVWNSKLDDKPLY